MLISKALVSGALFFATFSIFAMFYSLFLTQLKFPDSSEYNFLTQDNSTWFKPKAKVIMFIIDALRFDYLLNYENIDYDPRLQDLKFNQFNKRYFEEPEKFVIMRAISDTPTATVMRVPSLMTGNVPKKGSVLTAFGALPSIEDSIPRQLFNHGKKTGFAGDPILAEYFPNYMEVRNVEGFNLRDEEVDFPSQEFINEHIQEGKFDCLLSHLLHVDHAGHLTSLYSQEMRNAMADTDTFLMHIMDTIDDNTMLIFVGDHGMIKEGAHGSGSLQEINTAIVAYHKKGFMKNKQNNEQIKKVMKSINETEIQNHQADIVPTLSMLMGIPTPFSNMGKILNDLYPAGDYLTEQNCPDSAFEMQMLHDNHLNSLQVWNYFKKYHEGQSLFSGKQYSNIAGMFEKIEDAYKTAQNMIKESKQCEESFHEVAINAIIKSQEFSVTVYELVRDTPPYDIAIFWQGFFMLVLVSVSYFLIVQYLYKTKDYEHISLTMPKDLKAKLKPFVYPAILLALIWAVMLACGSVVMRPLTTSVLILAIWIFGSAIIYFLPKRKDYIEAIPSTPGVSEGNEIAPITSFLRPRSLLITGLGFGIILYVYYLIHIYELDLFKFGGLGDYNRLMVVMLITARICGKYPEKTKEIIIGAIIICPFIYMNSFGGLWQPWGLKKVALLFIGDWVWAETQFMENKFNASRLWSQHYWLHFLVIVMYHVKIGPSGDFIQIYLPRVVWVLIIASCLAGFALRLPRQTIKRNIQVNFVLYLCLMARPGLFFTLYFAIILSAMRILKHQFKKSSLKSPLYPLLLAFVGYIGLSATGYLDGRLPLDFGPAFVGLREFHLFLDVAIYSIAMTSTIILGMLFISFFDQEVTLGEREVEIGSPSASKDDSDCEKVIAQEEGYLNVIKKRNALYYCFFYCMIMIGAALNVMVFNKTGRFVLDKFLVDASLYSIVINSLYFML